MRLITKKKRITQKKDQPMVSPKPYPTEASFQFASDLKEKIVRDFHDPYLELIRLATEAAQIEHSLMLQYLFASFSVKTKYEVLVGWGNPNSDDLLGIAVQEMQHLGYVNRLLSDLEAAPHFNRQDFPYEPDVYPFEMDLAPLSLQTVAKYVYAEAPPDYLNPQMEYEDPEFLKRLYQYLGNGVKPNHLGSLYATLMDLVKSINTTPSGAKFDQEKWISKLKQIKDQGELDHYKFFKSVFLGTHFAFNNDTTIWDDPSTDNYPSLPFFSNPSAYIGHPNEISNSDAREVAWLSNLQYWIILILLGLSFTDQNPILLDRAKQHMTGPLQLLGRLLAKENVGLPFDHLSMGYYIGKNPECTRHILRILLIETQKITQKLTELGLLPDTYPNHIDAQTIKNLLK